MTYSLAKILDILTAKGGAQYGREAVSQLEHALQCATLAESANRSAELISACLLHDLGHLIHDLGEDVADRGIDDRHEYRAIPVLATLFSPAVTEPIRLHVEAKRYLCAVDPTYWDSLSPVSKHSLELQGGVFSPEAAAQFIQQPYAKEAVQLRVWDDRAKVPQAATPDLNHFVPILNRCLL
ncbi:phosphohydrolase [Oscillatoria sp. FACHB-1407]|uniref:phosphonate degradation HD-domain oxygenase n=1 Tax=Oscillatoria sp. FACHB-1407 TaxID=2692847 RepID=UPI001688FD35|nr:phosphonate degradation HD-domain oxygenase [Oscillatoria sp. FACHB-1407]MBD2464148.1 phosphohydrolase [Oscillatoria sp. FACHB-1407]